MKELHITGKTFREARLTADIIDRLIKQINDSEYKLIKRADIWIMEIPSLDLKINFVAPINMLYVST